MNAQTQSKQGYWKLKKGLYKNKKYNISYNINTQGFRGNEFSPNKSKKFRIAALGASSTMGLESNNNETWPAKLEKYLTREIGPTVEVINFGIGGYNSANHKALFQQEIINYKPDLVLYYEVYNDLSISNWERYPGPKYFEGSALNFLKQWLIYKKVQFRYVGLKLFGVDIENFFPWPNNWIAAYEDNLESLIKTSAKHDIPFVIVSQVLDYPIDYLKFLAKNNKVNIHMKDAAKRLDIGLSVWYLHLRQLDGLKSQKKLASKYDITFIDLHKEFLKDRNDKKSLFYDHVHLTPQGNNTIGEGLAKKLSHKILKEKLKKTSVSQK